MLSLLMLLSRCRIVERCQIQDAPASRETYFTYMQPHSYLLIIKLQSNFEDRSGYWLTKYDMSLSETGENVEKSDKASPMHGLGNMIFDSWTPLQVESRGLRAQTSLRCRPLFLVYSNIHIAAEIVDLSERYPGGRKENMHCEQGSAKSLWIWDLM